MVSLTSLWLPILVSAVVVFIASSVVHMMMPYHRSDFAKLASEDAVLDALRPFNIPPGDYMAPCGTGPKDMNNPDFLAKLARGPNFTMTMLPTGNFAMGALLAQWFVFLLVVSVIAAYVASRALAPGADYLSVFRFAGVTAFVSYSLAYWPQSIWYRRKWSTTMKNTFDGLMYGALTAGVFGWLWPK